MNPGSRAEWWRPEPPVEDGGPAGPVDPGSRGTPESAVPFWALMSFTFILLLSPQTFFPALASLRIALLAGTVAIATYLVDRIVHRRTIPLSPEMRVVAGLVGWAIVTAPMSYWPGGTLAFLVGRYLKPLAIFWLLSNIVNTVARLRRVAWGLTAMGVPVAATAVNNFVSGSFMQGENRIAGYEAPLTSNPNDLAVMLDLILPLTIALLLITRRRAGRVFLLGALVLTVVAVVVSFSRAGFLALATGLAMYLWRFLRRREHAWAVAALLLVVLVCVPLIPSGYVDRLVTIVDTKSDLTGSAQSRWNDMVAATHWVLRNPIVGAGLGQNIIALNDERGPAWKVVHNVYLEYAVDLGIPGLVLFLALLRASIRNARSVQRRAAGVPELRELFHLAEGIEISLVVFTVAAFFAPIGYQFHFYYIAGLAVAFRAIQVADASPVVESGTLIESGTLNGAGPAAAFGMAAPRAET